MIQTPHTYAEWVSLLELLKKKQDDQEVLRAMQSGTLPWDTGVAERFSRKLIDAVNTRMNSAADKFQRDLSHAGMQERDIVGALLGLRKEMAFLVQAVDLTVIPAEDRREYRKLITEQADKMQQSLEESARKDRSGRLANIVRNHRINKF